MNDYFLKNFLQFLNLDLSNGENSNPGKDIKHQTLLKQYCYFHKLEEFDLYFLDKAKNLRFYL